MHLQVIWPLPPRSVSKLHPWRQPYAVKKSNGGHRGRDFDSLEAIRQRIDAGEHAWAIEQLRVLIGKHSGSDVHRLLALAHLKGGSLDDAIAALDAARTLKTTSATEVDAIRQACRVHPADSLRSVLAREEHHRLRPIR
jgi:hypothetical protein